MASTEVSAADADAARREALRKAGEEYFESILAKAAAGRDPFIADASARRKPADVEAIDPDMETVGLVLKGTKLYFIGALFFVSLTVRLALASEAMQPLQTPAIQSFLHLLPSTAVLWAVTDLGPLTLATLKGSLVSIVLSGLQVVSLFGTLARGSVFVVIAWVTLVPQLVSFEREFFFGNSRLSLPRLILLAFGVSGVAVALVSGLWPALDVLFFLLLWASAEGFKTGWEQAKRRPDAAPLVLGRVLGSRGARADAWMKEQAVRESEVPAGTLAFYQQAIPAVPLLLLGFIFLEGSELVQHELSVPAVSMILMSMGAWAGAVCSTVLLAEAMPTHSIERLRGSASLASLIAALVLKGLPRAAVVVSSSLTVIGGACANLLAYY